MYNYDELWRHFRIDHATNKGSIYDAIYLITGEDQFGCSDLLFDALGDPLEGGPWSGLWNKIDTLRINGQGQSTFVADVQTLLRIIQLLPLPSSCEKKRNYYALYICETLGGESWMV